MVGEHERDMAAWGAEWMLIPQAMILASGALAGLRPVAEGLEVDAARMRTNLDLTHGAIMAEALMMAAAPVLGRDRAHHDLIRLSRAAAAEGVGLAECAGADAGLSQALGAEGLERALDPAGYLGESGATARRAAADARAHLSRRA